ncbi:MGMT family protein [Candidatus Marimicrobium litorale]|uniref:Methylated-DNA--[protein]-cysteine S-methyltransferase n=1 Tax=Candidatus Marimicrobium litorale TaxID=2518991 RepID=A0ABT3TAP1_9GAMM|nr:methylated-DNA--[protein]-cysteine S-methyltransferase [Candidatus Marimicrobium litorale]MCX2979114.1 methylated-DNA--[protein]-cysteine S-methyltransferase [Candidatus Marimicrobium litorale]
MTNYEPDINHRIWQVVALIPKGRVSTYGHVAEKAGLAGAARRVGSALRALPADSKIPWHRVLNSKGSIALPTASGSHQIQRDQLEAEGVLFNTKGRVDLEHFGW